VLLKGVNDDIDTLADLMRASLRRECGPTTCTTPDLAPGTSHFRLSTVEEGQALVPPASRPRSPASPSRPT
jgi:lysine 2,3-aminomutase